MADPETTPAPSTAERRGATAALGIFVVISILFVFSSAWQLFRGVFLAEDPTSSFRAPVVDPNGACVQELRGLAEAVERGISASRLAPTASAAAAAFEAGLGPEWDREQKVSEMCAGETGGVEAYGAVARLRRAGEAFARHRASDLAKPHEDVAVALGTPRGPAVRR